MDESDPFKVIEARLRGEDLAAKPAPNTKAPKGSYALPGGKGKPDRYPIDTEERARAALAYVAQYGSPEEKARVRAAVRRRYPNLPSSQGEGDSKAAKANRRKSG